MAYETALYPGEMVFDDDTPDEAGDAPEGFSRGREGDCDEGYAAVADNFPSELIIPRAEWPDRIADMERTKTRISDLVAQAGLPCKDQNGTNYCWINAPAYTVEVMRVVQNQGMVILSPASAGAPIKNFRNVGGWGDEGLQWIVEKGLVPVDLWPANAISRQYYTQENKEIALNFRVIEWWRLQPRNIDQLISCLLRRIPVACGYNWWRHEITVEDAVWHKGAIGTRIRNSWSMGWGDRGYSILQGSKMIPDDAVAPRSVLAT